MNTKYFNYVAAAGLLLFTACGATAAGTGAVADDAAAGDSTVAQDMMTGGDMMMPPMTTASAETKAILDKIKDYHSWDKFAENNTPKMSKMHMNMWVVTYHNSVVKDAIANKTLPLPDGAIIVKDNMMSATDMMPMPTVMAKQNGKWYWIEASHDGKVVVDEMMDKGKPLEGYDVKMCTGCHAPQKDKNDWLFTHDFTK